MPGYLAELMEVDADAEEAPRLRTAGDDEDADDPEGNCAWE